MFFLPKIVITMIIHQHPKKTVIIATLFENVVYNVFSLVSACVTMTYATREGNCSFHKASSKFVSSDFGIVFYRSKINVTDLIENSKVRMP